MLPCLMFMHGKMQFVLQYVIHRAQFVCNTSSDFNFKRRKIHLSGKNSGIFIFGIKHMKTNVLMQMKNILIILYKDGQTDTFKTNIFSRQVLSP